MEWLEELAGQLSGLPGVCAVALGGSRAEGTSSAASDWDVGVYYRGAGPSAADLAALGHPGLVAGPGEWGPVVNGGAWLRVEGRDVDLLLRDLDRVERWLDDARRGSFEVLRQTGYVVGAPTYLPVGELAVGRVLRGSLPRPSFPEPLRRSAPAFWRGDARAALLFASLHAERGSPPPCAALLAHAALAAAHAVLAERGQWVLNEKRLLERAGLGEAAAVLLARPGATSAELEGSVGEMSALLGLEPLETRAPDG